MNAIYHALHLSQHQCKCFGVSTNANGYSDDKKKFVYPNDINTNNYDYEYLTKVVIINAVIICQILKYIQYLGPLAHSIREL